MCGIVGLKINLSTNELSQRVDNMRDTLTHRGPNSYGSWVNEDEGLAFGHRRLSIIDLSSLGHQPMTSSTGRYTITFNGEIYNYKLLKPELENKGHLFNGGSDTEVLLASIEEWGLNSAVSRLVGMFAFALWDNYKKKTYLVRDRIGKKPLYYLVHNNSWAFASELKALIRSDIISHNISRPSLSLYMRYGYFPESNSIYENVYKVPPGCIVELDNLSAKPITKKYWDIENIAFSGQTTPFNKTMIEIVDDIDNILTDAVNIRMASDVPLGAFLSGGIDSSLIVALMQKQSMAPVKTYTIGFKDPKYNEAKHALQTAKHLGTDHNELYIDAKDLLNVLPSLSSIVDEPLADISILPTFLVSKLAANDVTVVLSGDGGDELFCGYEHYLKGKNAWYQSRSMHYLLSSLGHILSNYNYGSGKTARAGALVAASNFDELSTALLSQWQQPMRIVISKSDHDLNQNITHNNKKAQFHDIRNHMMLRDMKHYLVNDILHKVDRATMAVSLEARAPILDHRLIEYAWSIPLFMKHNGLKGKLPLRTILKNYVPEKLFERPKQGFGVPISAWLRRELKDWSTDLLFSKTSQEYFHQKAIKKLWIEHISGKYDRGAYLWNILVFLQWMESSS